MTVTALGTDEPVCDEQERQGWIRLTLRLLRGHRGTRGLALRGSNVCAATQTCLHESDRNASLLPLPMVQRYRDENLKVEVWSGTYFQSVGVSSLLVFLLDRSLALGCGHVWSSCTVLLFFVPGPSKNNA